MHYQRNKLGLVMSVILALAVLYWPAPAFSQQDGSIQDLIINGGFEGGFQQEYGIGYGWGGFSNGNAVVGWNFDDWEAVVPAGKYAQRIQIQEALEQNRYAGVYQTISVVPGQQYKLTIKGLVRSDEGDITVSDYGYRLQYAVDYLGETTWELVPASEWKELPWDEQPMSAPSGDSYRIETFETTITAESDRLTLFIRGWKKWIDKGAGIFDLDEISFVGPAPEGFQSPVAQAALTQEAAETTPVEETAPETPAEVAPSEEEAEAPTETMAESSAAEVAEPEAPAEVEPQTEEATQFQLTTQNETGSQLAVAPESKVSVQTGDAPQAEISTTLPVSGYGDDSLDYVLMSGIVLILILLVSAIAATVSHRNMTES